MDKEVYWDPNEQTIGILGVAPYATADFYNKVLDATPARKDWEHIRVLIDNNPKIPSRGRAIDLGETDPSPFIRDAIIELGRRGADFVAIPCNTAHYFYERFTRGVEIPVLNIIEETVSYILTNQPQLKKMGIMASRITTHYKLYDRFLVKEGADVISLPEEQGAITEIIESVKVGDRGPAIREKTRSIATKLVGRGAEAIILGCTELSIVFGRGDLPVPVYDSSEILAKECVRRARNQSG